MGTKERVTFAKEPEKLIEKAITKFIQESPANRRKVDGEKYWEAPLVGFATGNDPLFSQYKRSLENFIYAPGDLQSDLWKEKETRNLSVISWILPASLDSRKSNRKETRYPSRLWAHTRDYGENSTLSSVII